MTNYKFLKTPLILLLITFFTSQITIAQNYESAVGFKLGTYVGVSITAYTSNNNSFEIISGITREANQSDLLVGGFYRFHFPITTDIPTLNWYAGVGSLFLYEEDGPETTFNIAPGLLVGLEFTLDHTPVNFFVDICPHYNVTANFNSKFNIHANLGVRFVISRSE